MVSGLGLEWMVCDQAVRDTAVQDVVVVAWVWVVGLEQVEGAVPLREVEGVTPSPGVEGVVVVG